jgi:hypothetical protein
MSFIELMVVLFVIHCRDTPPVSALVTMGEHKFAPTIKIYCFMLSINIQRAFDFHSISRNQNPLVYRLVLLNWNVYFKEKNFRAFLFGGGS